VTEDKLQRNPLGDIGQQVRENLRELRTQRGMTHKDLAELLERLGRPIPILGLSRIENGGRRVDADDLVALSIALGVSPIRLLLPAGDPRRELAPVPTVDAAAHQLWTWALCEQVLLTACGPLGQGKRTFREAQDDFRRHTLPTARRLQDDHAAVEAATEVLNSVRSVLHRMQHPGDYVQNPSKTDVLSSMGFANPSTADGLRLLFARLTAEINLLTAQATSSVDSAADPEQHQPA
jgi:transcriptional regulator with XRE-family HTH domain